MQSFLYGDEKATCEGFFQTAAIRMTVCYPILAVLSISVADVLSILILIAWFFSGHWKERIAMLKHSPIAYAALPLILWTFLGVFRDGDAFFDMLRYWWGHYPLAFSLILATLLLKKETRHATLSSINLAIIITWGVAITLFLIVPPEEWREVRGHSTNLYRNTIYFGMGLVLWAGLWIGMPFTSRNIPLIRRMLPVVVLRAMRKASRVSPIALLLAWLPSRLPNDRLKILTFLFALLRWGVVVFVGYYLFWCNSSRTAQIAFLAAVVWFLLLWNWKKGLVFACLFCVLVVGASAYYSTIFQRKARVTALEFALLSEDPGLPTAPAQFHRAQMWKGLVSEIPRAPWIGLGMKEARLVSLEKGSHVDPHNEYLYILLQFGVIGLACFLLWLAVLFRQASRLPMPWRSTGVFVALAVSIDCMLNCALSYNRESHLFCILIALLCAVDFKTNLFHDGRRLDISESTVSKSLLSRENSR